MIYIAEPGWALSAPARWLGGLAMDQIWLESIHHIQDLPHCVWWTNCALFVHCCDCVRVPP